MMPRGVSLKFARTSSVIWLLGNPARAFRPHHHRHRVGHADRIRQLHQRPLRQPRRDHVLRNVARHVARRPVHLGRILARKRPAAVRRRAAVGVHDDLAARHARVAVRPAHHEPARRVHVDLRVRVHHRRRESRGLMIFSMMSVRIVSWLTSGLCWLDTTTASTRTGVVAVVFHRHLRLAVRTQIRQRPVPPQRTTTLSPACAPA